MRREETGTSLPTLKELRLKNGLTQKELAQQFGCSVATYSKIENYKKNIPEDEKHFKILENLLASYEEIVAKEESEASAEELKNTDNAAIETKQVITDAQHVKAFDDTGDTHGNEAANGFEEDDSYNTDYIPDDEEPDLGNMPYEDDGKGLFPESDCTLYAEDIDYDEKRDSKSFEELMEMFGKSPEAVKKESEAHKTATEADHSKYPENLQRSEKANPVPGDYVVYTDGSCLKNPAGPGGFAARIINQETGAVTEVSRGYKATTNNRMEIMAVLEALKCIPKGSRVHIYTDSQYVVNIMSGKNNYSANGDLWNQMLSLVKGIKYKMTWVKGHASNENNNRCDQLAREAAQRNKDVLFEDTGFTG